MKYAPLTEAIADLPNRLRFHMPGHKGKPLPYHIDISADLTELADTDNLYEPVGAIAAAQQAAAESAHAGHTIMLTNGATAGVITMLLYAVPPGGKVIMARSAHHSAVSACVLGNLRPVFVHEKRRPDGLIIPDDIPWLDAISAHADASAALVTSPTYDGITTPLDRISTEAKRSGMRLLVDQAHGTHWNWWDKPADAGRCGASMWVQSAHKTLPVLGQGAWLHMAATEDPDRARSILRLTQTSSPSYLLMSSLDSARAWMDNNGAAALDRLIGMLPRELPVGLYDPRVGGGYAYDPTRIVFDVNVLGLTGFDASRQLAGMGVDIEAADDRRIILIATVADEPEDFARLSHALVNLRPAYSSKHAAFPPMPNILPETACTLREAAFAKRISVPLSDSAGRVASETFGAYPPGSPIVMPGEIIPGEAVEWMQRMLSIGAGTFGVNHGVVSVMGV